MIVYSHYCVSQEQSRTTGNVYTHIALFRTPENITRNQRRPYQRLIVHIFNTNDQLPTLKKY